MDGGNDYHEKQSHQTQNRDRCNQDICNRLICKNVCISASILSFSASYLSILSISLNSNITTVSGSLDALLSRVGNVLEVKSQLNSQFSKLVQDHQMWIIFAQRATLSDGGCWLVHRWGGDVKILEIQKSSSYSIAANSIGTVEVSYSGSSANVIACAIRLY